MRYRFAGNHLANHCHLEDAPMIYEVRTYTLRPGTIAEFEERFAKRLPLREKHSKLGPSGTPNSARSIKSSTSIPTTTCDRGQLYAQHSPKTPRCSSFPAAGT